MVPSVGMPAEQAVRRFRVGEVPPLAEGFTDRPDTARGIAEWWINRDVPSTRQALLRLQECGVVQSYIVQGDTFVYAYTKRAVLRQSLARCLPELVAPPAAKEL